MVNGEEIIVIILRSIIAIFILYIVTRFLGRKQMSQLTIYDYIVGITIGSIAADAIISLNEHFINGIIAIITFGLASWLISYFSLKNTKINQILNGKSITLMENGEFVYDNLKKSKITVDKFLSLARLNGYYDINVIDYAILENNGDISFLKKEDKNGYQSTLIIDGEIQKDILERLGKDIIWLNKELKKSKINDIRNILLATINEKMEIKIYKKLI